MLNYLIFGITYGFIAAVQPGPLQTFLISQVIKKGWRSTLPASFSPIISDVPIFILIMFLLTNVPQYFIIILRILGGLFLFYLSYKAFISWKTYNTEREIEKPDSSKTLVSAVTVNLLNPNPYLGWSLIMGPVFLEGWNIQPIYGLSVVISFYLTLVVFLSIIIILFSTARQLGPKVSKLFIGLSALALFLFAVYQLIVGLRYYI